MSAADDPADEYLSKVAAFGSGIRILNQDLWEMIITFIISQQKTIPAIRALVEALSEKYGTRYELSSGYYYAFPTPEELNHASLDDLLALKLGYRAKYIKRTCEDVCSGKMDLFDPGVHREGTDMVQTEEADAVGNFDAYSVAGEKSFHGS